MKDWADKYNVWGWMFGESCKFFYFSAAGGARKLMKSNSSEATTGHCVTL